MKIAVISDIHANLEALEACLKRIDELKADKIICLGDLVDYCAEPNECIELIRNYADVNILGNHDEAQFDYELAEGFTEHAYISSVHTRSVIRPEHVKYFKTLPYTYSLGELLFVHGSPAEPPYYEYVLTPAAAMMNFKFFEEKICFIGHSHRPVIFQKDGTDIKIVQPDDVTDDKRYIINVGSVGQPRDGDSRLSFGFLDTETFKYQNVKVTYPSEIASAKILNEGLPAFLAERILKGI
jgi:predicted phosphodiesterase